jgi:adenylate cyclase
MIRQNMSNISQKLNDVYDQYLKGSYKSNRSDCVQFSQSTEITPLYSLQRILRPYYGKGEPKPCLIGDHPDFTYLKGKDQQVYCPITTMFMDLEGSTRLELIYSLEEVQRIKNAFITATIEIVKTFDGHVHRIMGDAVMAFFGGWGMQPELAVIDAINCVCLLQYFVKYTVMPRLESEGFDNPFGIRIGLDYSPDTLWSSYGYPGMNEVTATSFHVSVASKLQHSAPRNQIMIGQSLKEYIDFPDELLKEKQIQKNGERTLEPFLKPNLTHKDGRPINYKQFILDWETYLQFSPLIQRDTNLSLLNKNGLKTVIVDIDVFDEAKSNNEYNYFSCSYPLQKNKQLRFGLRLPYMPMLPYTVRFSVENHGQEAFNSNSRSNYGNHETTRQINMQAEHDNLFHWESSMYRGLHYMIVEIKTHREMYQTKIGVYVI